MNHYTYIVEGLGKQYIGVRSCKYSPIDDTNYLGSSKYLNEAIKEHGKDKFSKQILAMFDTRKLAAEYEIRLHEKYDVGRNPEFWNLAKHTSTGFDMTGVLASEETRQRMRKPKSEEHKRNMRKAQKGKVFSEETRQKLSEINKGNIISKETRKKISLANKGKNNSFYGKQHSDESKRKMSLVHKGKVISEETKRKMSEANKGKRLGKDNPMYGKIVSAETRKKISEANSNPSAETRKKMSNAMKGKCLGKNNPMYGKHHSEEIRQKISLAHKGKPKSEEHKRKISEAHKRRFAN